MGYPNDPFDGCAREENPCDPRDGNGTTTDPACGFVRSFVDDENRDTDAWVLFIFFHSFHRKPALTCRTPAAPAPAPPARARSRYVDVTDRD